MKQRVITAVVGMFLFFVILFFFETYLFNIAISLVAVLIVYEVLLAYQLTKHKLLSIITCFFAALTPLIATRDSRLYNLISIIIFVGLLFGVALKQHEKLKFDQIAFTFFVAIVFPYAIVSLVYIRDQFGLYQGLYYTLLIFACAWGADTGAYFVGRFFGKRKLSPKISPNKTVEGLLGGIVSCLFFVVLVTLVYYYYLDSIGIAVTIHYVVLIAVSIIGSLIGVVGDLSASLIKRQRNIKDFGTIMPGHGGVLDRFDSVLFIAPFFFVVLQVVKCIS